MEQTKKYREFCSEPMDDKSIIHVPGIGDEVAAKLMSLNYTKARELYGLFKNLQYNEKQFEKIFDEGDVKSKGCHVSLMCRAFNEWRNKFDCPQETKGNGKSPSPEDPNEQPSTSRGGRRSSRVTRDRPSEEFNLPPESLEPMQAHQPRPAPLPTANAQDLLVNLFTSLAGVVRTTPQELHGDFILDILNIINEYEEKALERSRQAEESS